jgi:P-type Ca2+ transporter type 2C
MNAKPPVISFHWQALSSQDVIDKVESRPEGISSDEAQQRVQRYGLNKLPEQLPPTWWQIFFRQFYNPLIFVLALAAIVAVAIGDWTDAGFIAAVLLLNAIIGGYQEWRAEQSSRALQQMLHVRATVLRDGESLEIDAEHVVPGDMVWLESGNRVPADLRLLSVASLQIDESVLTGESVAVAKDASWIGAEHTAVGDRLNMAYAGAVVSRGRGKGVVVATGAETLVGQLAEAVAGAQAGTAPLLERMHGFARLIAVVVIIIATVIGGAGVAIHGVGELQEIFLFTVALAVAAIPEGLPAALTVALSIATSRMAKRRVIVRRLAAVEGLGSCTLIASDKTGTLTRNELTVRMVVMPGGEELQVTGQGFEPNGEVLKDGNRTTAADSQELAALVQAGVLCNEGDLHRQDDMWKWRGDPTDIALLTLAEKAGLAREPLVERWPKVNEIPFEAEHRYAATFHRGDRGHHVFVKGAAERILDMCSLALEQRQRLVEITEALAAAGYRVLALASGPVDEAAVKHQPPPEPVDLQLQGFIGMIDPLREGVKDSIVLCHRAGIRVCMITGDHPVTASAIAVELGIAGPGDAAVTGRELDEKSEQELQQIVREQNVFARVAPKQKLDLVKAAQAIGHFVAVTGDGVNDAPALRAANIGVAMGKSGTDVAREAAELVVSDDDFSSIVGGVEEGRVAYDNVRKVVAQLTATGAAEVMLVCLALAAGGLIALFAEPLGEGATGVLLPLLPVQLLWLNLVTNGIQGVALAFEPSEGDVLRRPPRPPEEPIFNRLMIERTLIAAGVMAGVSFAAFLWMLYHGWEPLAASNVLLLLMVLFENIHVGNNRSETKSGLAFSPLRSPYLLAGVLTALGIHILAMNLPMLQRVLRTEPVSLQGWAILLALACTVFVAIEIHKWSWAKRYGPQNDATPLR